MSKPGIVVVDLDGTLCNSSHREHLAKAGLWEQFHELLMDDEPWADVEQLIDLLSSGKTTPFIVGLTGRNECYRLMTIKWLDKHKIHLDELLMRPDNDYRSDVDLKPQLLDEFLEMESLTHADVWFILEDRDKVVEAWRNLGHNCWQPRPGGY